MEPINEYFWRSNRHFGWAFVNWGYVWFHPYTNRGCSFLRFRPRAKYVRGQESKAKWSDEISPMSVDICRWWYRHERNGCRGYGRRLRCDLERIRPVFLRRSSLPTLAASATEGIDLLWWYTRWQYRLLILTPRGLGWLKGQPLGRVFRAQQEPVKVPIISQKYSNKLSMKAHVGWKYVVFDSIFRIQTVLEWVLQQVILRSSCF